MTYKYKYSVTEKKYISRSLIKNELKLSDKEFDELVTLVGIYPYVPKEKQKIDKVQDFYYKITDYEKLKNSDIFKTFKINKVKANKKQKYLDCGLTLRANKIKEIEYEYVDMVAKRFNTFGKAVDELGNSLFNLCLAEKLKINEEVPIVLEKFKEIVKKKGIIKHGFISTKGIYYEINIKKLRVIWLNPYSGEGLSEIIEIKKDEPVKFKWSELNCFHFASESSEEEDSDEEYIKSDKLDISLLHYALPINKYHLELVLHKIEKILPNTKNILFENIKFFIDCETLYDDLKFVIEACSGIITKDKYFDICLGDEINEIVEDKIYLHPQYVFDCLNNNKLLNRNDYMIGKTLPKHVSPFKINNFVSPDVLTTLSKRKRNLLQDIIDGFEDVHYKEKKVE